MASLLLVIWGIYFKTISLLTASMWLRFSLFAILVLSTSGVYVGYFLQAAITGQIGGHNALAYGMDVLALLIPGGHWRFNTFTAPYWQHLSGNIHESSVHVGLGVMILAGYGYVFLKHNHNNIRYLLFTLIVVFTALSLGKNLQIWDTHIDISMPYSWLEQLIPFMSIGGVPIRFIIISILAISMLAACGTQYLSAFIMGRIQLMLLLGLGFWELLPSPIPNSLIEFPPYIQFLAQHAIKQPGAVLDLVNQPQLAMMYQTLHQQPIHTGYLARIQSTVGQSYLHIQNLIQYNQWETLKSQYGFRYVIAQSNLLNCRLIYAGPIQLYEILY